MTLDQIKKLVAHKGAYRSQMVGNTVTLLDEQDRFMAKYIFAGGIFFRMDKKEVLIIIA